jgi:hypothetical protein
MAREPASPEPIVTRTGSPDLATWPP